LIRFLGRSAKQVEAIDAWWRDNRPQAPDLFASELEHALGLLARAPGMGVPYAPRAADGVRRLVLSSTRYHVYYVHEPTRDFLGILAVWSSLRGRPPSLRFFKGVRRTARE
jgi:plasmid stabilization system protein ParE